MCIYNEIHCRCVRFYTHSHFSSIFLFLCHSSGFPTTMLVFVFKLDSFLVYRIALFLHRGNYLWVDNATFTVPSVPRSNVRFRTRIYFYFYSQFFSISPQRRSFFYTWHDAGGFCMLCVSVWGVVSAYVFGCLRAVFQWSVCNVNAGVCVCVDPNIYIYISAPFLCFVYFNNGIQGQNFDSSGRFCAGVKRWMRCCQLCETRRPLVHYHAPLLQ